MSTWTSSAVDRLEDYLNENRTRAAASGADGDEVAADLRRHIETELATLKLPVVTDEDVRQIIARTGVLPEQEMVRDGKDHEPHRKPLIKMAGRTLLLVFGVLLPAVTLAVELATHMCAGVFFDPFPTWLHVAMVAMVALSNAASWRLLRDCRKLPQWAWWMNGGALGTSVFYAVLFLPLSPFALIGILYLGLGLLPLSPLFAMVCTLRLRRHLRRQLQEDCAVVRSRGWWLAALTALITLVLFALPEPLTRHWVALAGSDSPGESLHAIRMLRTWGSEEAILKEAYGGGNRFAMEFLNGRAPDPDLARKVYYRVTGKAFNSEPPPLSKYQRSGRSLFDEFDWDDAVGGEAVAGQVRGLSVQQSRLDGLCEPDHGWAYVEWTFEFRNDHWTEREARAQIQLPPGAVVSRVTLWVNGEPREAAFAGRAQVRQAYQQVAVRQRRDPLLVTMSGPDRVLMQCFPIPSDGGTMKVRLGITAPLLLESTNLAVLRLPEVIERNFRVPAKLEHNIWLESRRAPQNKVGKLTMVNEASTGRGVVRGQIANDEFSGAVLKFACAPANTVAAKSVNSEGIIVQRLESAFRPRPARVAIVLDGSKEMNGSYAQIAQALNGFPRASELAIWLAQDGVQEIFDSARSQHSSAPEVVGRLRGVGGQDALPALLQAWEWVAAGPLGGAVLWIHGSQPMLLGNVDSLLQRLEWRSGTNAPLIIDVPIRTSANRIAEQLSATSAMVALERVGTLEQDLERLMSEWAGRRPKLSFTRAKLGGNESAVDATANGSKHIVRLWAAEQVRDLAGAQQTKAAVDLAARHQLVTLVSGAVVLETAQQYAANGLTPVDPATVPLVPEPGTVTLMILALACVLCLRYIRRVRRRTS